jgi:hypothetical protein
MSKFMENYIFVVNILQYQKFHEGYNIKLMKV